MVHKVITSLTAALIAVTAVACSTGQASTESLDSARPTVLRYCYSPNTEEPQKQALRLDLLKKYLSDRLKVDVEMYRTSGGYGVEIEAMRAKKVDVTTLGPFGYVIAAEKAGAEVIVVSGTKDTGQGSYRGIIAVPRNSPIKTIDELRARSHELTFSFVDPASTSGFLVQRAYFQSVGLDPDKDFKKSLFSMNHIASAMTLIAGKVDAAAMMQTMPRTLAKRGRIHEDDIRVLWTSPDLPSSPIAVRSDLPESFKREIQQAMIDIPQRAPEIWKVWPKENYGPNTILVAGNDAMFDGLRTMMKSVKNLSLLEQ